MAQLGYWAPESRAGGADLSVVGGEFIPNIETTETKYFGRDELPENLAWRKDFARADTDVLRRKWEQTLGDKVRLSNKSIGKAI